MTPKSHLHSPHVSVFTYIVYGLTHAILLQGNVRFPNGNAISASVSRKRANELFVSAVPADLTINEFQKILKDAKIQYKDANLALSQKFKTDKHELKQHHAVLAPLLPDAVHVEVTCPKDESMEFRVFANFARAELALRAVEAVNGRPHPTSGVRLTATPRSNLSFFVSEEIVGFVEPTFLEPYLRTIRESLGDRAADLEVSQVLTPNHL
jgi:hypothetical protein